jgi:hypothetical protein
MTVVLPRWLLFAAAVLACVVWLAPAPACPFCGAQQGATLVKEVDQASMVLFGSMRDPKKGENLADGTTEFHIDAVIKDHEILDKIPNGRKVLTLNRYIPEDSQYKYLVFCDVYKGKIDPYQGRALSARSDVVDYLTEAVKLKGKDQATRLKFYFGYLDNKDSEISNDAYKEFALADYKDLVAMYKDLPPDRIAGWLRDRKGTPSFRFGLYGSMLGHCGKDEHAAVIRNLLDDQDDPPLSGVDGLLAGYVLLKPKEGYEYACKVLKDPEREWQNRYAALRAVRFFWEYRTDVLDKQKLVDAAALLLDQGDICDLAIEDFRKWQRWELAPRIMSLKDRESHKAPIVQRAIIRYALTCPPEWAEAQTLLAEMREKNPKLVKEAQDLLRLENPK